MEGGWKEGGGGFNYTVVLASTGKGVGGRVERRRSRISIQQLCLLSLERKVEGGWKEGGGGVKYNNCAC